uniref:Uncharacterized protein n=1 Tax=Heterorhabditis bacteriophora TaxID=37862 RepID=A0A1I7X5W0_HETBA
MAILREQLSSLSIDNTMEFLSGIRKISYDLQVKSSSLTEELASIEENLSEQLDCLKGLVMIILILFKKVVLPVIYFIIYLLLLRILFRFKLDLLLMREQVVRLKDDHCHYATLHAPSILSQLHSLSSKQSLLRKLKCEERGNLLLSSCRLTLEQNEHYGIDTLSSRLMEALDHKSIMLEDVNTSATSFFLRSVSRLALEKTQSLLRDDKVLSDVFLFSHLVDECISYEEQRLGQSTTSFLSDFCFLFIYLDMDISHCGFNVLTAFCEPNVLSKWIEVETESCIALMDDMLSSTDRWQNRFRNMEEADLYMVCECADSFVSLLHSLQLRAKLLPDEIAQVY